MSPYVYAENNPVLKNDPTGLLTQAQFDAIVSWLMKHGESGDTFEQTEWTAGGGGGFFEFRSRGDAVANELRQSAGGVWRYDGNTRWKLNGYDLGTRDRKVYLDRVGSDPSWKFYPDPIKSPFDVGIDTNRDYVEKNGGIDHVTGKFFFDDQEAYNYMNETSRREQKELAMALLPNGMSYIYPWAENPKFGPKSTAKSFYIKGMIAVVHTHQIDSPVSGEKGDLGISNAYQVPIYAVGPDQVFWGAALNGMQPFTSTSPLMPTANILTGVGGSIRDHANSLLNALPK